MSSLSAYLCRSRASSLLSSRPSFVVGISVFAFFSFFFARLPPPVFLAGAALSSFSDYRIFSRWSGFYSKLVFFFFLLSGSFCLLSIYLFDLYFFPILSFRESLFSPFYVLWFSPFVPFESCLSAESTFLGGSILIFLVLHDAASSQKRALRISFSLLQFIFLSSAPM